MNVTYKRSIATTLIFGTLLIYLIVFFAIIGPEDFLSAKWYLAVTSAVVFIALMGFALMLLITNKKDNIVDERDNLIQKQASSSGLTLSLIYVFALSFALFMFYRDEGTINVSWAWFIAYSTFAFGYFSTSMAHVYLFYKGN